MGGRVSWTQTCTLIWDVITQMAANSTEPQSPVPSEFSWVIQHLVILEVAGICSWTIEYPLSKMFGTRNPSNFAMSWILEYWCTVYAFSISNLKFQNPNFPEN